MNAVPSAMTIRRAAVRPLVWAIALAALGLRLGFVLTTPARALYWDEPTYQIIATGYLSALGGAPDRTVADAVRLGIYKGEVYTTTTALLYAVVGPQPRAIFILQALLDTATCLLLFGLARALGGVRAGVIALTLAAFYEPFIFAAARLQTETMAALLCVGALWALCVPPRRRTAGGFLAGILIALAMLTKPALQWLVLPLVPAVFARNWDRALRARCTAVLVFAAGFCVVIAPRAALTWALLGQPAWTSTLHPGQDLYSGAVPANVGWKTDGAAYAIPPRDELLAVLGDPPPRGAAHTDMQTAALRIWRLHPADSAAVALHKLYVAWLHPYNDSHWSYLTGLPGQEVAHRVLLALALIGMPLSLRRWRVAVVLLVATLYVWLTYLIVKIEVRYAVTAMPMMICFAAVALAALSRRVPLAWRAGRRGRLTAVAAATLVGFSATLVGMPRLLEWLPLTPDGAQAVRVAVIMAMIAWLGYVSVELRPRAWRRSTAVAAATPSVVVAVLVVLVGRPLAQDWREWHATLAPNRGAVRQEFVVPAGTERPRSAALLLDLLPGPPGSYDVVVRLNGKELKRFRGGLARGDTEWPAEVLYQLVVAARGRTATAERAWYRIPIPPDAIVPNNQLAVELTLEGGSAPGLLQIFGDYSTTAPYAVPSLFSPQRNADTSVYKYIAEEDFRLRRPIELSGASRSRFDDGHGWSEDDLAADPGRQVGRYRIFLVLETGQGVTIL